MPADLPNDALDNAEAAIAFAQQVRAFHRKRSEKESQRRQDDIASARERLREAMVPIRSAICKFSYGPQTDTAEANREKIREVALRMSSERRKLTKMTY